MTAAQTLRASFRDPSGFLFHGDDGQLYRQINRQYQPDFELFERSGLYDELVSRGALVPHEVASGVAPLTADGVCIIRPRRLEFISYPYEWAFSALKDAALLTLDIQLRAMKRGMQLKDASAYNVQFAGYQPLLIDTLSFEKLSENRPWKAYGQFCRHFLAPLALMSKTHIDLGFLLRDYIDGIPLDVASRILPWRTRTKFGMLLHLHWHGRMIAKHQVTQLRGQAKPFDGPAARDTIHMPTNRLRALLENLRATVASLKPPGGNTEWADYYEDNSYSDQAVREKRELVARFLAAAHSRTVWDLGANTGVFSRLACEQGAFVCAFDIDPSCIEAAYQHAQQKRLANFLPLRMDLTNPSPALGWAHQERDSLCERGPADTVMALALIHHLAISNNVPLRTVAEFLRQLCKTLIIEFVPKNDPQVRRLLQNREDIFNHYHQNGFEEAFRSHFQIEESAAVGNDGRRLYRMTAR